MDYALQYLSLPNWFSLELLPIIMIVHYHVTVVTEGVSGTLGIADSWAPPALGEIVAWLVQRSGGRH